MELVRTTATALSVGCLLRRIASALLLAAAVSMTSTSADAQEAVRDAWTVDCQQSEKCILYYVTPGFRIYIGEELEGDRLLMEVRVGPSVAGTPMTIRVDTGYSAGLAITECAEDEANCRLILDLEANDSLMEEFKAGSSAMAAYVIDGGESIIMIPFSLNGFTASYNQLTGG